MKIKLKTCTCMDKYDLISDRLGFLFSGLMIGMFIGVFMGYYLR